MTKNAVTNKYILNKLRQAHKSREALDFLNSVEKSGLPKEKIRPVLEKIVHTININKNKSNIKGKFFN